MLVHLPWRRRDTLVGRNTGFVSFVNILLSFDSFCVRLEPEVSFKGVPATVIVDEKSVACSLY